MSCINAFGRILVSVELLKSSVKFLITDKLERIADFGDELPAILLIKASEENLKLRSQFQDYDKVFQTDNWMLSSDFLELGDNERQEVITRYRKEKVENPKPETVSSGMQTETRAFLAQSIQTEAKPLTLHQSKTICVKIQPQTTESGVHKKVKRFWKKTKSKLSRTKSPTTKFDNDIAFETEIQPNSAAYSIPDKPESSSTNPLSKQHTFSKENLHNVRIPAQESSFSDHSAGVSVNEFEISPSNSEHLERVRQFVEQTMVMVSEGEAEHEEIIPLDAPVQDRNWFVIISGFVAISVGMLTAFGFARKRLK